MNKQKLLKAFAKLSAEDQAAVRAELTGTSEPAEGMPCGTGPMHDRMMAMMQMMTSGENPMASCQDMMEMCQARMHEMSDKSSAGT